MFNNLYSLHEIKNYSPIKVFCLKLGFCIFSSYPIKYVLMVIGCRGLLQSCSKITAQKEGCLPNFFSSGVTA